MKFRNTVKASTTTHRVQPQFFGRVPDLVEHILVGLILFCSAMVFCMPVPSSEYIALQYPWWAKRLSLGNVQLHEMLFLAWILIYGWRFLLKTFFLTGNPTRPATDWLIILALWCGLMSLAAPLPWLDTGRTLRLLLNAALLLAVVDWARRLDNFPLGALILGFFSGTLINLAMSYCYPTVIGGAMRLAGQNTPGVAMAVAIHLACWLYLHTRSKTLRSCLLLSLPVFFFGSSISFSRIAWGISALGVLAWIWVFIQQFRRLQPSLRKGAMFAVAVFAVFAFIALASPTGNDYLSLMQNLIRQKVAGQAISNGARWNYVTATAEIISLHPLGVGYSGFYKAMTHTDIYLSGKATREDDPDQANPHATFLWYTTAGGVPGSVMALILFVVLLAAMRRGLLSALGHQSAFLFYLAALSYGIIGATVPYLFNSIILLVPTAIAAGWKRFDHHPSRDHSAETQ